MTGQISLRMVEGEEATKYVMAISSDPYYQNKMNELGVAIRPPGLTLVGVDKNRIVQKRKGMESIRRHAHLVVQFLPGGQGDLQHCV